MKGKLSESDFALLKRIWSDADVIPSNSIWSPLEGGKTNPIWHVETPDRERLVCKLFIPNTATPLFANDGTREALALRTLSGSDIAPDLLAFRVSTLGETLVYRHVPGTHWRTDVTSAARLMARVHRHKLPDGLPDSTVTPASLIAEAQSMGSATGSPIHTPPLIPTDLPKARRVFLHGDIVPGNIINTPQGLRLIDWQCPTLGDPCADIAIFLSPAMQHIYGHRSLTNDEVEGFLSAYQKASGDDRSVARYRALAPLFAWRMLAYCGWKQAQGDTDYAHAAKLEMAALQQA